MKKRLLWLAAILVISGSALAAFLPMFKQAKEIPATKTMSFTLYKDSTYGSKAYKTSSVQLRIIIEKVRKENRIIIWDTTLDAKLLSKYPFFKNAVICTISVSNVYKSSEHIEMSYNLIYNSNGNILTLPSERYILNDSNNIAISI